MYIHLFCLDFSFHCITIRKLCILFLLVICKSTLDTKGNKQKKNCHDYTIHNFSNISKLHNIWCLNPFQVSSCIFVLFLLLLVVLFSLHFIPHSYIFFWPFSVFYLVLLIYFVLSFYFSAFSLLYLFFVFFLSSLAPVTATLSIPPCSTYPFCTEDFSYWSSLFLLFSV